jgi:WD40 repeat protein
LYPYAQTGKTLRLFKGHSGPVTSLALWTPSAPLAGRTARTPLLISGSWDKTVRISEAEVRHTEPPATGLLAKARKRS